MGTVEGRVDAFKFLWPTIQQVSDRLERSAIADEVAGYLNLDRETVRQQFKKTPRARTVSTAERSRPPSLQTRSYCSLVCCRVETRGRPFATT